MVGKVDADNFMGLEREDFEARDQPLPTIAKGMEAHVLAIQQKEDNSLAEMGRISDKQVGGFMVEDNGVLGQVKLVEGDIKGGGFYYQKSRWPLFI